MNQPTFQDIKFLATVSIKDLIALRRQLLKSRSDYCLQVVDQRNFFFVFEEKNMRSALPKLVSSILIMLASLYPLTGAAQAKDSAAQLKLTPSSEAVNTLQVVRIEQAVPRLTPVRTERTASTPEASAETPSDHKTGTILATLVLMVAIAIRRHRSGRR